MKIVRVHNPSGLMATKTKRRNTTVATRRETRKRSAARRSSSRASNPRRRRRRHSRRHNPGFVARAFRRSSVRRRKHSRRRNPSALRIGQIAKDMIYGAGGAILTRAGAQLVVGFVPGAFAGSPFVDPAVQALVAATAVRYAGKKFLGPAQGDIMMLGGLISAGLSLADKFVPGLQGQITGIFQRPVITAPQAAISNGGGNGAMGDVEDVDLVAAGFGDVEDIDPAALSY